MPNFPNARIMKRFLQITFWVFSICFIFDLRAIAQVTARRITRRITESNAVADKAAAPAPATVKTNVAPPQILTNTVSEKTKEQKEEILQKTIAFQKKRAEEGAPTAQYDLGMRYLNGDGVEKNLELAQKWLQASAANGHTSAIKKLEELKKK